LVSRTVMPARVSSRQVLAHKLAVFTSASDADLAFLSSSFHSCWAWRNSSTMKSDLNYSPSDVFETLTRPIYTSDMRDAGGRLDQVRRQIMSARGLGLTKVYNLVNDPSVKDSDIATLRACHRAVDMAVAAAYGWTDLSMEHGFHPTRQGVRHTFPMSTRIEILDRLLEANHQQQLRTHIEEQPEVLFEY
ncbi:hypothetical protein ABZ038_40080, partial [Streptomyces sp. NPDC006349]